MPSDSDRTEKREWTTGGISSGGYVWRHECGEIVYTLQTEPPNFCHACGTPDAPTEERDDPHINPGDRINCTSCGGRRFWGSACAFCGHSTYDESAWARPARDPTDEAPGGRKGVDRHEPSTWTNERLASTLEDFIDHWAPATTTYKAHMEAARRLRQPDPIREPVRRHLATMLDKAGVDPTIDRDPEHVDGEYASDLLTLCHLLYAEPTCEGEELKVVTLCGSSRFVDLMAVVAWELEKRGHIVHSLHLLPAWYGPEDDHQAEAEGVAEQMDELHLRKIDRSDEVLVIDLDGYIGESTSREIDYAERTDTPISYLSTREDLHDIPIPARSDATAHHEGSQ